ncbi:MAG: hypothetical protein D3922_09655, partial [Candidatus Electrothrix sp. AR1]|nr:hypothetical protein [Candidatus Electrothrix sp. AR1]
HQQVTRDDEFAKRLKLGMLPAVVHAIQDQKTRLISLLRRLLSDLVFWQGIVVGGQAIDILHGIFCHIVTFFRHYYMCYTFKLPFRYYAVSRFRNNATSTA